MKSVAVTCLVGGLLLTAATAAAIPNPSPLEFLFIDWHVSKSAPVVPGPPESAQCQFLPEMYCIGSAEYCTELAQFEPAIGADSSNT